MFLVFFDSVWARKFSKEVSQSFVMSSNFRLPKFSANDSSFLYVCRYTLFVPFFSFESINDKNLLAKKLSVVSSSGFISFKIRFFICVASHPFSSPEAAIFINNDSISTTLREMTLFNTCLSGLFLILFEMPSH